MKKYKLIIFDFDGTLADTSEGILNSVRYTQKMMQLPEITMEQMISHIGPPMDESYNRNFGLTGDKLKQAVCYHKEYAVKQGYKELELYNGIPQLLSELKENGYKTAIATLKAQPTVDKIVQEFGIADKFDIIKGVDVNNPMSKSQLLGLCISELQLNAADSLLIGDSEYDAIGAEEAGIDFLAVTYGYGFKTTADAEKHSCIGVCGSAEEIGKVIFSA